MPMAITSSEKTLESVFVLSMLVLANFGVYLDSSLIQRPVKILVNS